MMKKHLLQVLLCTGLLLCLPVFIPFAIGVAGMLLGG